MLKDSLCFEHVQKSVCKLVNLEHLDVRSFDKYYNSNMWCLYREDSSQQWCVFNSTCTSATFSISYPSLLNSILRGIGESYPRLSRFKKFTAEGLGWISFGPVLRLLSESRPAFENLRHILLGFVDTYERCHDADRARIDSGQLTWETPRDTLIKEFLAAAHQLKSLAILGAHGLLPMPARTSSLMGSHTWQDISSLDLFDVTIEGEHFARFLDRHSATLGALTLSMPNLVRAHSENSWMEYAKLLQGHTQYMDIEIAGHLAAESRFPIDAAFVFKQPGTEAMIPVSRILRFLLCGKKKDRSEPEEEIIDANVDWDALRFEDIECGTWTMDNNGDVIYFGTV